MALSQTNIASPRHKADPFPFYARLRSTAPVLRVVLPNRQIAWLVSRYQDVESVLTDRRFVKDRQNAKAGGENSNPPWLPGFARALSRNMLDLDGDDHSRLRRLVGRVFTPSAVGQMRGRIASLAKTLADELANAKKYDLVRDYARHIPTTIIAEMLGIPPEDRERIARWSNIGISASGAPWRMLLAIPAIWKFLRYIRAQVAQQRSYSSESDTKVIARLIAVQAAEDCLSDDELIAMVFLLVVAGHETTVSFIANSAMVLLNQRDELHRLSRAPERMPCAVEELLRFAGPLETATERFAAEDVTLAGVTIPRGSLVLAALASANRDEGVFDNPDALLLDRQPNEHLAFGLGPHYCIGATLARLEAEIALNAILPHLVASKVRIAPRGVRWRRGLVLRGLASLPLVIQH